LLLTTFEFAQNIRLSLLIYRSVHSGFHFVKPFLFSGDICCHFCGLSVKFFDLLCHLALLLHFCLQTRQILKRPERIQTANIVLSEEVSEDLTT
jgi:hypothetical protein